MWSQESSASRQTRVAGATLRHLSRSHHAAPVKQFSKETDTMRTRSTQTMHSIKLTLIRKYYNSITPPIYDY